VGSVAYDSQTGNKIKLLAEYENVIQEVDSASNKTI
jgi:hypothetical protein